MSIGHVFFVEEVPVHFSFHFLMGFVLGIVWGFVVQFYVFLMYFISLVADVGICFFFFFTQSRMSSCFRFFCNDSICLFLLCFSGKYGKSLKTPLQTIHGVFCMCIS